jgi:putative Holliday junction resolvase
MAEGTVLSFDFGTRRIGVAIGEPLLGRARALTTIEGEANDHRFAAIAQLIAEWQPARLVVGLPLSLDGTPHEMTARCRRFAHQLEGRFRLPVAMVDERLSSAEAEAGMRGGRKDKAAIDAEAARIILQDWFDHAQAA